MMILASDGVWEFLSSQARYHPLVYLPLVISSQARCPSRPHQGCCVLPCAALCCLVLPRAALCCGVLVWVLGLGRAGSGGGRGGIGEARKTGRVRHCGQARLTLTLTPTLTLTLTRTCATLLRAWRAAASPPSAISSCSRRRSDGRRRRATTATISPQSSSASPGFPVAVPDAPTLPDRAPLPRGWTLPTHALTSSESPPGWRATRGQPVQPRPRMFLCPAADHSTLSVADALLSAAVCEWSAPFLRMLSGLAYIVCVLSWLGETGPGWRS